MKIYQSESANKNDSECKSKNTKSMKYFEKNYNFHLVKFI